ncbi:hypothetical protein [Sulfurimonas sp.]|uniref:hypothetical protein n=1 Tax=Sulfurimonas sp. TaxID=2022749 RepID=UPI002629D1DF|nr:hypothetical protein [Sulfurimonas sp.]
MKAHITLLLLSSLLSAQTATDLVTFEKFLDNSNEVTAILNDTTMGLYNAVSHSEIEYGEGTFAMEGSLLGLDKKDSTDITSYTLKSEHQNLPIKQLNYNYKINYYTSGDNDKLQGIDADFGMGYNLVNISKDEYISLGIDLGVSLFL